MKQFKHLLFLLMTLLALNGAAQNITSNDEDHNTASEHSQTQVKKRYIIGAGAIVVILVAVAARKRRKQKNG